MDQQVVGPAHLAGALAAEVAVHRGEAGAGLVEPNRARRQHLVLVLDGFLADRTVLHDVARGGVEHEVVLGVVAVKGAVAKHADRLDGAESGLLVGVESLYLVADRELLDDGDGSLAAGDALLGGGCLEGAGALLGGGCLEGVGALLGGGCLEGAGALLRGGCRCRSVEGACCFKGAGVARHAGNAARTVAVGVAAPRVAAAPKDGVAAGKQAAVMLRWQGHREERDRRAVGADRPALVAAS